MDKKKLLNYATPVLLGVLMFASNFLNTKLFNFGDNSFAVWFVLSLLCFATGWYILKTLGWRLGGKVIFAIIISVTFISVIMISMFMEYFSSSELLTENLILYSLRNITLGGMAFFGMSVSEIFTLQKNLFVLEEKLKIFDEVVKDAKKEAELDIREAKIKAEKIINDAEATAKNTILKKERIERELKEFIQSERELIKKYEEL
jgi:hypothetical protein